MKKTIILALLILLVSCKNKEDKPQIEKNNNQKRVGTEEWKKEAEIYLNLKEGETILLKENKDFEKNKPNIKEINNSYSTKDIEFSEEWRVRAFKATKEYLRMVIPNSLPNCHINSFGYYESNNIKYIGNNTFRVKTYLTIKCKGDNYINKKYFWVESRYSENTNKFKFNFLKERFAD